MVIRDLDISNANRWGRGDVGQHEVATLDPERGWVKCDETRHAEGHGKASREKGKSGVRDKS
eukprot:756760-Hanusia_phi.AAC.5